MVFGFILRSYVYKFFKKVCRLVIKFVLVIKVVENNIVVFEDLVLNVLKIKDMLVVFKGLIVEKKVFIVIVDVNEFVELFVCNIFGVIVIIVDGVNVLDVFYYDKLIMIKVVVEKVEEVFV